MQDPSGFPAAVARLVAEALGAYLKPPQPSGSLEALADCPAGPGEADLWVVERVAAFNLGRGCLSARFDRDRVRLSGKMVTPMARVLRKYLDPGADLGPAFERLGADVTSLIAAQLGPKSQDRVLATLARRQSSPAARKLGAQWNGVMAAAGGPRLGEMTLVLDTGEVALKPGSVVVQRGTNHAWANRSGKPCRMLFVLIDGQYAPEIAASLP